MRESPRRSPRPARYRAFRDVLARPLRPLAADDVVHFSEALILPGAGGRRACVVHAAPLVPTPNFAAGGAEMAARAGVSENTFKSQLKEAYLKRHPHRQVYLLELLLAMGSGQDRASHGRVMPAAVGAASVADSCLCRQGAGGGSRFARHAARQCRTKRA